MAFDPTQSFATYANDVGNIYYYQGGSYYDQNQKLVSTLPATVPGTGKFQGVATITRPANVTAYGAGSVIGGVAQFSGIAPTGTGMVIVSASLMPQIAAIPTGMTSFTLHMYKASPPSALANAATWTQASGDLPYYLGNIALGSPALQAAGSAALWTQADSISKQVFSGTSDSIYAYLVTNGGFTPANNSEVYTININAVG